MKRVSSIVISILVLAALVLVAYERRAELAARIWHWRHGDTIQFGGYVIPIPPDWLVRDQNDISLELVDTGFKSRSHPTKGVSWTVILYKGGGRVDLDLWRAFQKEHFKGFGGQAFEEHTTHFDDQTVVCVRTYTIDNALHVRLNDYVSLDCGSSGELDFLFGGYEEDLQSFYRVVEQIRKVNFKP